MLLQQRPDRRVELLEGVEGAVPQRRVDALIGQPYGVLDQRLVARMTDSGEHDDYPIVLGERVKLGVDARLVGIAATDRAAQVVRDDHLDAAAAVAQRPFVGADPVLTLLRGAGLHVGQFAGPEDRHERFHRLRRAALRVHDGQLVAGVVDEQLLPGLVVDVHAHLGALTPEVE